MFEAYISRAIRVDLVGAVMLGRALANATDMVPWLPEQVLRAKLSLERRIDALDTGAESKTHRRRDVRSPIAIAGRDVDTAWIALYSWLEALASLPGESSARRSAAEALNGIFPEGVCLVRPPPLIEWSESEARIGRIDKGGFEATLRVLGGGEFVEAVRKAHATYDALLGDTSGAMSSRAVTQNLDACVMSIHAYVTCVLAELCHRDPEDLALACTLLAPLDFALEGMNARSLLFDQTLRAYPPPPPLHDPFEDTWADTQPIACAS